MVLQVNCNVACLPDAQGTCHANVSYFVIEHVVAISHGNVVSVSTCDL